MLIKNTIAVLTEYNPCVKIVIIMLWNCKQKQRPNSNVNVK